MAQQRLWYDAPEDAFRALVDALGGYKRVGVDLWPSLPADRAGQRLAQCLDPERAEKLSLSEIVFLIRRGRAAGCHVAMAFFCEQGDYAPPEIIDPETEIQKLQREFNARVAELSLIAERIESRSRPAQAPR